MAQAKAVRPPLSEEQARELLAPHETLRDPVQHDITITALERTVIDTSAFQRLRLMKQLGPTDVVYPGAVHTRFLHCIGTIQCAEQLVQTVNRNFAVYSQPSLLAVEAYPHVLVRLCALLHDVAHIPFGHTLEDEGNLVSPEWEDTKRAEHWLGEHCKKEQPEIPSAILQYLVDTGIERPAAEAMIQDIRQYLLCKDDHPMHLEYPFVVDLVGNTICADLLDYLDRDMYFCGLRERAGDRAIKYVAVMRVKAKKEGDGYLPSDDPAIGKGRVVLLTYRYEREHLAGGVLKPLNQPEILSEIIDLLRRRFALAEKVYFHRTKIAASAMLVSAAGSAVFTLDKAYESSDSDLLASLQSDPNPRTQRLIDAYRRRRLYRPVYRLDYRQECDTDALSKRLWEQKYPEHRDPRWRRKTEEELEEAADLPPGSVAIYCPDRNMNIKAFKMLVQSQPGGEVKPLERILETNRRLEMDAINGRFPSLWALLVLVDPRALDVSRVQDPKVQDFNAVCEALIDFPNDLPSLRGKGRPLRDQLASRAIQEWEKEGKELVPYDVFEELVRAEHRGKAEFRDHLEAAMKSRYLNPPPPAESKRE